ncbi:PSME3-interacting protein [Maylandia zebra]|uniref:PSME3-interacting protein n=1 Tax=Maylandia zebra TaxID=106582 RepID=UPI0003BCDB4C|nr:PSME3-interacting protein isoform X1 [Haplochromis burtoni]XP_026028764.1 protein FAM192A isoform X1 [Astatotilapia calliptera]XP_026028765.1 protein FAM192A isoform X1 [Astatotilapia calliptera]XP_042081836.1 PSME3-interacting protein isoform X1 [Haplochromis burtoni]
MEGAEGTGVDLSRKFVSEAELDERRKKRQEEWEKIRKPDDPEEVPEEEYDPRSLFERLQEQKDKKQEEYEEQFKFKNMVRGLDEDESSFLDEVSRQQCLVEKQRRDEEKKELLEYRSALVKQASAESRKEPEKKVAPKGVEHRTSHLSQAHLLVGAVKRRNSSQSDSSKKQKVEITATTATTGNGEKHTEEGGGAGAKDQQTVPGVTAKPPSAALSSGQGVLHLPSAAVCVGVLPGLCVYSGSSDSDSSSDSEGSVDAIMSPYPRHNRAYR